MRNQVKIFDSTLRDGEQAPGIALDPDQKVMIAAQLAKLGVDIIEAGFPTASPGDFQSVKRIAQEVQGPTIAALARAQASDVDRAWEAIFTFWSGSRAIPGACSPSLRVLSKIFTWCGMDAPESGVVSLGAGLPLGLSG